MTYYICASPHVKSSKYIVAVVDDTAYFVRPTHSVLCGERAWLKFTGTSTHWTKPADGSPVKKTNEMIATGRGYYPLPAL